MPITSSVIVEDRVQRDRRRAVREQHRDHTGVIHEVAYLAEADADVSAMLPIRAALIEDALAAAELAANEAEAEGL